MGFSNIKFLISVGVVIVIALGGAGVEIWRLNGALSSAKAETQDAKDKLENISVKDKRMRILRKEMISKEGVKSCQSKSLATSLLVCI